MKNHIEWLRESYRTAAREFTRFQVKNSRAVFGRDIHHVMLLHLGAFSSHILPDLFRILKEEGFEIVTLEEAQRIRPTTTIRISPSRTAARSSSSACRRRTFRWPANAPASRASASPDLQLTPASPA